MVSFKAADVKDAFVHAGTGAAGPDLKAIAERAAAKLGLDLQQLIIERQGELGLYTDRLKPRDLIEFRESPRGDSKLYSANCLVDGAGLIRHVLLNAESQPAAFYVSSSKTDLSTTRREPVEGNAEQKAFMDAITQARTDGRIKSGEAAVSL